MMKSKLPCSKLARHLASSQDEFILQSNPPSPRKSGDTADPLHLISLRHGGEYFKVEDKKIVFFGTPEFALPTLTALKQRDFNIISVITQPPKPQGRNQQIKPTPVEGLAKKLGLTVNYDWPAFADTPDLGIVVAYGKIIPASVLKIFKAGCLNIHPSLLPKYRGPSPIQTAILNGDRETGVTIIKLDDKMDHGPIVKTQKLKINNDDTQSSLSKKLADLAVELLIDALPDYFEGKVKLQPQNEKSATFSKIILKENGQIDWHKPASEIEREIRAYQNWPGSFTKLKNLGQTLAVKIIKAELPDPLQEKSLKQTEPGICQSQGRQLFIRCQDGFLSVIMLQPENKKEMTVDQFISGYSKFILSQC